MRLTSALANRFVDGARRRAQRRCLALPGASALAGCLAATALLAGGLTSPLLAEPNASTSEEASSFGGQPIQLSGRAGLEFPAGSQLMAGTPVEERPAASGKAAEEAKRRGRSPLYGLATKPGFYAVVEQTTAWAFPATGAHWGTGAGNGATFLGLGVTGNVRGNVDTLMIWSLQAGPAFQHEYNVPGNDRTPVQTDAYFSISPGVGNDFNIYAAWRGLFGNDVFGQNVSSGPSPTLKHDHKLESCLMPRNDLLGHRKDIDLGNSLPAPIRKEVRSGC